MADSINDPIIDIEPGTGTLAFNGTFTFTISQQINGQDNSNCSVVAGSDGTLYSCGTSSNFIRTPDLGNVTGQDIGALTFTITTTDGNIDQGVFSAPQPPEAFPNSLFRDVNQTSPFSATFTGSILFHNCTVDQPPPVEISVDQVLEGPPTATCNNELGLSEFNAGLAGVIVPHFGSATVTITSSPVPEPSTYGLVITGLGTLCVARRRFLSRKPS
ncbi:MAG TPA: PEP-CTERM sorting domain-containing protein [Terriglobales bacterium]|nr:PEP-CTERM sorting domain-containing protein [Terriglobales bacterium]